MSYLEGYLHQDLTKLSGPCQTLTPELESAAETLSSRNIYISTIDCTTDVEICTKYDVKSYPTIRIFSPFRSPIKYRAKQQAKQ